MVSRIMIVLVIATMDIISFDELIHPPGFIFFEIDEARQLMQLVTSTQQGSSELRPLNRKRTKIAVLAT
jgi:hypothetical protein